VFLDAVKVAILRIWSFELVAKLWPSKKNLLKLAKRKEQAALDLRLNANMSKFRKIEPIANAVKRMKGPGVSV
jgi:H+-transporting ATPase